jgi:hypothetical protein
MAGAGRSVEEEWLSADKHLHTTTLAVIDDKGIASIFIDFAAE